MSESLERLARNQSLFREVNERLRYLADVNERIEYVAEGATEASRARVSNPECVSTIELTVVDYERVRSNPTWFGVTTTTTFQSERVVSRDDGFAVVEKLILEESCARPIPRSDGAEGSGEGTQRASQNRRAGGERDRLQPRGEGTSQAGAYATVRLAGGQPNVR